MTNAQYIVVRRYKYKFLTHISRYLNCPIPSIGVKDQVGSVIIRRYDMYVFLSRFHLSELSEIFILTL